MQEERMKVLEMINEGKITADEGAKLLEALRCGDGGQKFEEKFNKFAHDTKDFFKDVGGKINEMYKEVEPKVKSATQKVVSKTADIAENISQKLDEKAKSMEADCGCCCSTDEAPEGNGPRPEEKE
ncbi:MAG: hypothetical protein FWB98_05050 [Defluviitaleaceae bacterium]|nr:hypothetical protein [Defluviitaleaceae bacterium]